MLNLNALDNAYTNYKQTLVGNADECGREIKTLTDKLASMDIGDVYFNWGAPNDENPDECDFTMGLKWDCNKAKILYWFDSPQDLTILAGQSAKIRAYCRPFLNSLINEAVKVIHKQDKQYTRIKTSVEMLNVLNAEYGEHSKVEDDELESYERNLWKEPEHGGPSEGDSLMTNGIED